MAVPPPSTAALRQSAERLGLHLNEPDLALYGNFLEHTWAAFSAVDDADQPLPATGRRGPVEVVEPAPGSAQNPHNAWYVQTSIKGAASGPLAGRTVAVKDCFMVAGLPMLNGSGLLEGYIPEIDATVVQRVLAAGGTIVGKSHCEYLCASGGSHSNVRGPVYNPLRLGYSAGGSSSGNAALLASGDVDLAIGSDQAGSIRMPAAFCGVYGMKPTYGLVPFTGGMSMDGYLDHAGPMSRTVHDNALLLEVLAGPDGYDFRQTGQEPQAYTAELDRGPAGLRIALVREGFGHDISDPRVDEKVRAAVASFAEIGATVEEISIPELRLALPLLVTLAQLGGTASLEGGGFVTGRDELYVPSLAAHLKGWRSRADDLSDMMRLWTLSSAQAEATVGATQLYGKAVNLARSLRQAVDRALARHDLLALPTTPMVAFPVPDRDQDAADFILKMMIPITNTCAFNISHHPAMSLPCAQIDGLPVGLMLVGRFHEEAAIYRAAYGFERLLEWRTR